MKELKQNRLTAAASAACALLAFAAADQLLADNAAQGKRAWRKPNIVFFLIDDLGWSDLGCYGNKYNETPNIDLLAAQGIKFTDFYAATPVCSSTRCTIQTGQYSPRVGITDFIPGHWRPFEKLIVPPIEHALPENLQTVGSVLKRAGYVTAYLGKWHLGPTSTHGPAAFGYQSTEATLPKEAKAAGTGCDPGPKNIDKITDQAIWFIEHSKGKPFFVTLSHYAVHIPIEAEAETIAKYEKKRRPQEGVNNPRYAAMLEHLDRSVGRVLAKLKEARLDDSTLVLFSSDNGGLYKIITGSGEAVTSNRPLRSEKGTLYEGGIRVPLIIKWPGVVTPGNICRQPACTIDLLPTFCDAAKAKLPKQPIDGISLLPVLQQPETKLAREAIFFHYPHYHHSQPAGAVRMDRWKLIEYFDGAPPELYDLAADPGETTNVAREHKTLTSKLLKMLAEWRESVGARMPRPNPNYDPKRAVQWWNRHICKPLDLEAMAARYKSRTQPTGSAASRK